MPDTTTKKNEDFMFKCPSCKEGIITIDKTEYDLPDSDKMLIIRFVCNKCDYHKNDIIPLTTRMESGKMILKVTEENDLKSKVYRSPTGKLEIPELELVVEPGPNANFYYTNIQGILFRFEQAVSIYRKNLNDEDPEVAEIEDILKDLKKAINGNLEFTLIITDLGGGSYIIPLDKTKYSYQKIDIEENQKDKSN
ncbi:MAG: ZPR1 zinc finger domain-containing protein [Candidatus Hermodarchaeota archaeon]